jgi:hypothetical protein
MFDLEFALDPSHYARFARAAARRVMAQTPAGRQTWRVRLVVALLVMIATAGMTLLVDTDRLGPAVTIAAVAAFLFGYLFGVIYLTGIGQLLLKGYLLPGGPVLGRRRLQVGAESVRVDSGWGTTEQRWAAFGEAGDLGDLIVLWMEPGSGHLVSRRAVGSEADVARFLDFARTQIAAAAPERARLLAAAAKSATPAP